jgi:hypothetical protein
MAPVIAAAAMKRKNLWNVGKKKGWTGAHPFI